MAIQTNHTKGGIFEQRSRELQPLLQKVSEVYGCADADLARALAIAQATLYAWKNTGAAPKKESEFIRVRNLCRELLENSGEEVNLPPPPKSLQPLTPRTATPKQAESPIQKPQRDTSLIIVAAFTVGVALGTVATLWATLPVVN